MSYGTVLATVMLVLVLARMAWMVVQPMPKKARQRSAA